MMNNRSVRLVGLAEREHPESKERSLVHTCRAPQLALAQERERRRIAAGLHDDVGQLLAVARMKLGKLVQTGARGEVAAQAMEIDALVDRAIVATRSLTFELSSPVLYELGLGAAVESLCEQLGKESGIRFSVEVKLAPESLTEELRILLYQAVRELCANVVKHARAPRAALRRTLGTRAAGNLAEHPPGWAVQPQDLGLIKHITEQETPAHVVSRVISASHPFLVGMSALVGVDSYLAHRAVPKAARIGAALLGKNNFIKGPAALDARLQGYGSGTPISASQRPVAFAPDVTAGFGDDISLDGSDSRAFGEHSLTHYNWKYIDKGN